MLLVVVAAVSVGCTATTPKPAAPTLPPPAEPAVAPTLTVTPAGRLVPVGAGPEGVVADAVTHLVAVGVRQPNTLVVLDGTSGQIVTRTPLPGHLRHLQLAGPGGPVLVPDENSNSLLTVDLPGGKVDSAVVTGTSPHDATRAGNGLLFAANEGGASVAVVRGDIVVHRFTDVVQPAGLAAVGNQVGLVDVRQNALHVYDAGRLTAVAQVPAGAGPTHVVADRNGEFVVIDTRGNAVLVYQLTPTLHQVGRLVLPGTPYGVAYDAVRDHVWVTLTARNELVGLSLDGGDPKVFQRIPTVRQPNTVAVDAVSGRLFVTGTDDGVLELIDP